jgi:hypothetical protein
MKSSPDNDSGLQSLLKLKRYERPPSPYFDGLSEDVLHRLRGPEGLREQSLFRSLGLRFGWKPILFYGVGAACCLLALYGVISLVVPAPPPVLDQPQTVSAVATPNQSLPQPGGGTVLGSAPVPDPTFVSTNPVMMPGELTVPPNAFKLKTSPARFQAR